MKPMKKLLCILLCMAMVLSLAACAGKVEEPDEDRFEDDVLDYINEMLDEDAEIEDFEIDSTERDDDKLEVVCIVTFGEDETEGVFTLKYELDGSDWELEKCKVKLEDEDKDDDEETVPEEPAVVVTQPVETEPTVEVESFTLTVWGPSTDQADENSFLPVACELFAEAHPEWDITFVYEVCSEGDAGTMVTRDPSAAADVYAFANDQLGALIQANAIARLGGAALEQVLADNSETMVASVTSGEGVYGVPFTGNTWFMYYDKSVYTEEDIKSLDAMMAKKPVGFEVTNTWYLPSFYFAAGGTMFGENGTDGAAGVQFGGENGAAATLYVANALAAGTLVEAGGGAGLDAMRNGTIGAMFSGTWDAKNYKDALGDNYAAAQLPCITLNGVECQLRSFSGSKAYAANPNSANLSAAVALAAWLGSAEMQDLHYQIRNGEVVPCSVALIASGNYDTEPAAVAQNDTIANTSVLQPSIPEMSAYWTNAGSMGQALINGEINADNAAQKTEEWNAALNSGL